MPKISAELEQFVSSNPVLDAQIGSLYRILVGDPEDPYQGPSYDAFFYPEDDLTVVGESFALLLKLEQMSSGDVIELALRSLDPTDTHQINIEIKFDEIFVSELVDDYHLKIGASSLLSSKLEITNWKRPWIYSQAPQKIDLVCQNYLKGQPSLCYDPKKMAGVMSYP